MNLEITWHESQFNVSLCSKEGAEPFLTVKGCRIASGSKGDFVSWPATKNQSSGKYWQHVWGSDKFNAVVLERALATQPRNGKAGKPRSDDTDLDVPY